MKPPKPKDGYTRIPNKIIEALADIRISGEEMQCLWVILRKTNGWGKKEDMIALSQFVMMTGIKKPNIIRALKKLTSKKIIVVNNDNAKDKKYKLNKDLKKWRPLSKKITVIKKDNASLSKKIIGTSILNTKETTTKERIHCGFAEIAEIWNETVTGNLPKIRYPKKLNNERKKAIRKAWKDYNDLEDWRQIFKALSDSPHHQGNNDKDWVADFDWIMKPENYPRFYDRSAMPKKKIQSPPAMDQASSTYVGAHEPAEKTPQEWELFDLRIQRTFAKRGECAELTTIQEARLKELESAVT